MQGGRTAGLGGYAQRFLCLYVFAGTERRPLPAVTGATCGDLTETKPVRPAEPRPLLLVAVRPAARCLQLCARNAPDRCPVGKAGCPPRPPHLKRAHARSSWTGASEKSEETDSDLHLEASASQSPGPAARAFLDARLQVQASGVGGAGG